MFRNLLLGSLLAIAALTLFGRRASAREYATDEERVDVGAGFSFVYQVAYDTGSRDVIVPYGMEFNRFNLVRNERRLQFNGARVALPYEKKGLTGLNIKGVVIPERKGNLLHWHVSGKGHNQYAPKIGKISESKSGAMRIPFSAEHVNRRTTKVWIYNQSSVFGRWPVEFHLTDPSFLPCRCCSRRALR